MSRDLNLGLYLGYVTSNRDPEALGRVRVRVPGLVEPESAWAYPLGTVGGGSGGLGFYAVPEEGATVGVLFRQGSTDQPFYISGHWGKPGGESEAPQAVQAAGDTPHLVRAFDSQRYSIIFCDIPGEEYLLIRDKQGKSTILLDGPTQTMQLEAPTAITLKATGAINIDALAVTINGRVVAPGKKPI